MQKKIMNFIKFIQILLIFLFVIMKCMQSEEINCGVPSIKPVVYENVLNRIINGENAVAGSWPWIVSLRQILENGRLEHICGGSLIDLDLVLTAAHCVVNQTINTTAILVDSYDLTIDLNISNIFYPKEFKIHSNYKNSEIQTAYDIALIRLTKNISLSNTVGLVCLPGPNDTSVVYNKTVYGTGWYYLHNSYRFKIIHLSK